MSATRFAPSSTGPAHAGTLLSALICWLDARKNNRSFLLRFEDLDPNRCHPKWTDQIRKDLSWFGLDWDAEACQSQHLSRYHEALDQLELEEKLYACRCSRAQLKSRISQQQDGAIPYDGQCRDRVIKSDWRSCNDAIRVRLEHDADPVVFRRDGVIGYHLACVVDDAAASMTHIIRGNDLRSSESVQKAVYQVLMRDTPRFLYHGLLLDSNKEKFSKSHLRNLTWSSQTPGVARELCGKLAELIGISVDGRPVEPRELLDSFEWSAIHQHDIVVGNDQLRP